MKARRMVVAGVAVAAIAAGTAGAVATGHRSASDVIGEAADQLGVEPGELRSALEGAGGSVEGLVRDPNRIGHRFGPPPMMHGGPGPIEDLADALDLTPQKLFERFRDGDTLAEIAKAQGKDLADVKAAVKAAALKRLDAAVEAGDLTKAQRDELAEHLDEHLAHLGEAPDFDHGGPPGGFRGGPPGGFRGGPPGFPHP